MLYKNLKDNSEIYVNTWKSKYVVVKKYHNWRHGGCKIKVLGEFKKMKDALKELEKWNDEHCVIYEMVN